MRFKKLSFIIIVGSITEKIQKQDGWQTEMRIVGTVSSEKGFYIGDLCYALNDRIYDEVWGGAGYVDGIYTVPGTEFSFAVAGTAYGDGTYKDNKMRRYDVDAGNISLMSAELVENTNGGHYFEGAGIAVFIADGGVFEIILPNGERVNIDTKEDGYWDDEEDEDYWDDDDEDELDYFSTEK